MKSSILLTCVLNWKKKVFKIRAFQNFLNWWSLIADSLSIHEKKRESNITFPEKYIWSKEETTEYGSNFKSNSLIESLITYMKLIQCCYFISEHGFATWCCKTLSFFHKNSYASKRFRNKKTINFSKLQDRLNESICFPLWVYLANTQNSLLS